MLEYYYFFPNGCRRRNLFVFFWSQINCQHGDRNQLVQRSTLALDIDSTHGQPAWYLARPTNIDDGLQDIRCTHGLGGGSLPAVSYGILINLKKVFFCHSFETDGEVLSSVLRKPTAKRFFIMRLVSSRHMTSPMV